MVSSTDPKTVVTRYIQAARDGMSAVVRFNAHPGNQGWA